MDLILDQSEKNYYLNIREFKSGAFEAVMRLVKPMSRERTEAIVNGLPVTSPWDRPVRFTKELTPEEQAAKDAENHYRSVKRSKQMVRWLTKCMEADRLLTLTYRENMQDREKVRAHFRDFIRRVRKHYPDWKYVAVLEKQDRGALHIHLAVKGFQRIKFIRACWYKALGGNGSEVGDQTPGAVNITSPTTRWGSGVKEWKTEKLAAYITKYLQKTFDDVLSEKRRYWSARGIDSPPDVRRCWVGGSNIFDAIKSCLSVLEFDCGLYGVDFDWWISPDNDMLFISGRGS